MKRPYQRQSALTVRRDRLTTTDSYGQNGEAGASLTCRSSERSPTHTHRPGTASRPLLPRLSFHLDRAVPLQHRHVDAELHAAGVHRASNRVGGARRPARVHAARSAAAAVDPRRCARRPAPPPPVPDRHAARADGVQRRLSRPRRRRLPALDAVRRVARHRHRQCTQHSGLPGQRAAARPPFRPRRRGEPQLGDDQRQPGDRAGAGSSARRAGRHHLPALPRQRRDLSVPRRRAAPRDRSRRGGATTPSEGGGAC